ncbi:MAG: hypothetical protein ACRCWF_09640 [Beijerinckiaceae bacterium]
MNPAPRRVIPKRQGLIRRPVRTRMDASAELLRLEYERDKLGRQMVEARERYDLYESELAKVTARAAWLHAFLDGANVEHPAAKPQMVAVTVNVPVPAAVRGRRTASMKD